jgi:prepilin-type N-terminal cleavage/methylation domain-containing protein
MVKKLSKGLALLVHRSFMRRRKLNETLSNGFTLLELLIVIGLIGILISIAATSYSTAQKKSRDSRRMGDLKAIQNALEQYYADNNGNYPVTSYVNLTVQYLPTYPVDPKTNCYYKQTTNDADAYYIAADLEGTGGFTCTTPCGVGAVGEVSGLGCEDDYVIENLQ